MVSYSLELIIIYFTNNFNNTYNIIELFISNYIQYTGWTGIIIINCTFATIVIFNISFSTSVTTGITTGIYLRRIYITKFN